MANGDDRDFVRALARGLAVIESFNRGEPAATLSDVARRTALSRGTAARLLKTLETLGYVRSDGRFFMLQPRALKLGYAYLSSQPLWRMAQPMLETIAHETGEICSLAILDETEIVYVSWVSATRVTWDFIGAGGRLPAFCTSMGRALLAGQPKPVVDDILARSELVARTPRTITDIRRLHAMIDAVRRNGYATQDEEVEPGQRAIAVPVHDQSGLTIAALNITVAAHRYTLKAMTERALAILLREAEKLGEAVSMIPSRLNAPTHAPARRARKAGPAPLAPSDAPRGGPGRVRQ